METAIETGLSKTDITALKTADDVYAVLREGQYLLRCIKRVPYGNTDPWAEDKRHEVLCIGYQRTYTDRGNTSHVEKIESAFASIWHSEGIWQILRPGDRIRLIFSKNGLSSENLRSVGYVGDSVTIEVVRKSDVDGQKPLRFYAASYVGPDNSARICR